MQDSADAPDTGAGVFVSVVLPGGATGAWDGDTACRASPPTTRRTDRTPPGP